MYLRAAIKYISKVEMHEGACDCCVHGGAVSHESRRCYKHGCLQRTFFFFFNFRSRLLCRRSDHSSSRQVSQSHGRLPPPLPPPDPWRNSTCVIIARPPDLPPSLRPSSVFLSSAVSRQRKEPAADTFVCGLAFSSREKAKPPALCRVKTKQHF